MDMPTDDLPLTIGIGHARPRAPDFLGGLAEYLARTVAGEGLANLPRWNQRQRRKPSRKLPGRVLDRELAASARSDDVVGAVDLDTIEVRMLKKISYYACLLTSVLLAPSWAFAADRYVRQGASGTGSGADWANAYPSLPATLGRGDTYYIADGSYGSYTFDDPASGTTLITLRKATVGNHGTSVGWSDSYGDGKATFTHWNIYTDYYLFDGVQRNSDWRLGALSAYGIGVAGTRPVRLDNGAGTGADNLTFRYIDFQGGGRDTGSGDDVIYGLTGNSNITFQNCALHDSDRTIFLMRGNWRNLRVDSSYLARNTSTPAIHGELLSMTDSDGVVFSNNVIEDIEGTAVFAGLNNGAASNWKIYGNVVMHTANYVSTRSGRANFGFSAFIFVANDASNNNTGSNFLVYNNTFYNIKGLWSGVVIQAGSGGNVIQNNIWYSSVRTGNQVNATVSHNWYYNTVQDGDSSSTKVVCTSNCSIFVDAAGKNLGLAMPVPAGIALSSPYNIDPSGQTRGADGTWDRGAFEYRSGGTAPTAPAPPLNVQVVR